MDHRVMTFVSQIIALFLSIFLVVTPSPVFSQFTQQPPMRDSNPQEGFKPYGAGQVLATFNVDLAECWVCPWHDNAWYLCEEWNKNPNPKAHTPRNLDYVWPRTISYTNFTVPSEGALLMEVKLEKDAAHPAWLGYDIQRYDDASAKWVSAGWYWKTEVRVEPGKPIYENNKQYDLRLLSLDSDGKPWHPVLKNFPVYPAGKYRVVAWEPPSPQTDAYPPAKGSFTVIFIPSGNPQTETGTGIGTSTDAGASSSTGTGTSSALPVGNSVLRDYDKSGDSFSFANGKTCSGCNFNITNEDFFIADRGSQSIIHAFESPGVMDVGNVTLDSVKEAPVSGYQDTATPIQGHTYVFKSRGKYGKIQLENIRQIPTRPITEYEFKWAYQANGTRSFATESTSTQPPVSSTQPPSASSGGVYENYHGSADTGGDVRMNYWHAQTFTAQSNHPVSSVKIMVYRIGNPGSLIVSLRATDTNGHPTGTDLLSGTTSGDTLPLATTGEWREVGFPSSYNLTSGIKYAIIVRAPGGGGGNVVKWLHDNTAPDYKTGNRESSGDSGATWQADPGTDYLFEVLGAPSGPAQSPTTPPATSPSSPPSNPLAKTLGKLCPLSTAYGSPEAPELCVFRQFRDRFLAKHPIGTVVINTYYYYSPFFVELMMRYEILQPLVKYCLAEPTAVILNNTNTIWNN